MKARVLMIEDDNDLCDEMKCIFQSKGYDFNQVHDGIKGFQMIEDHEYDVILLDLKLPGMSGCSILKQIIDQGLKTKVIVLSGSPIPKNLLDNEDREGEEMSFGNDCETLILKRADAIMNKPFNIEKVICKIDELVEQKKKCN